MVNSMTGQPWRQCQQPDTVASPFSEPSTLPHDPLDMHRLLEQIERGELSIAQARARLSGQDTEAIGYATLDHGRAERCGFGEVVFAEHKDPDHLVGILRALTGRQPWVLATRCQPRHVEPIDAAFPGQVHWDPFQRTVVVGEVSGLPGLISADETQSDADPGPVVVSAGTSDAPVAEEAALTLRAMGESPRLIQDVGVAGLQRILGQVSALRQARVVIVIAGMEGALPSVVGGLVSCPVIAVPTSVGYGASFGGVAALLGMLNSCASGVVVVNIDSGFNAAYAAALMCRGARTDNPSAE